MSEYNPKRFEEGSNAQQRSAEEQRRLIEEYDQARYDEVFPDNEDSENAHDEAVAAREYEANAVIEGRIMEVPVAHRMYMMAQEIADLKAHGGDPRIIAGKEANLQEKIATYVEKAHADRDIELRNAGMEHDTVKGREIRVSKEIAAEEGLVKRLEEVDFINNSTNEAWVDEKMAGAPKSASTESDSDLPPVPADTDSDLPPVPADVDDDDLPPVPADTDSDLPPVPADVDDSDLPPVPADVDDSDLPPVPADMNRAERIRSALRHPYTTLLGIYTGAQLNRRERLNDMTSEEREEYDRSRSRRTKVVLGALAVIGAGTTAYFIAKGIHTGGGSSSAAHEASHGGTGTGAASEASYGTEHGGSGVHEVLTSPANRELPSADGSAYPWDWAKKVVGPDKAEAWLEGLSKEAAKAGHDVQWHGSGTHKWVSIDNVSRTKDVIDILRPFANS